MALSHFVERVRHSILQRAWTASIQRKIDIFEAPDQIENIAARDGPTGRGTKVRATTKWPIFVNQTVAGLLLKHGARSIGIFR